MRQLAVAAMLAVSFAASPAWAGDAPNCTYDKKDYPIMTVLRMPDGRKDICLCDYDPGSNGSGYWKCEWQLYQAAD